jgi:hypothetical protein
VKAPQNGVIKTYGSCVFVEKKEKHTTYLNVYKRSLSNSTFIVMARAG